MRVRKTLSLNKESGQAMIETVLILSFVLLPVLLNAVNFGYFFMTLLNLQSAPRTAAEYSVMGGATPALAALPPATSNGTCTKADPNCSVSSLLDQDLLAFTAAPTNADIQVCSQINGFTNAGKTTETTVCTNTATPSGYNWPSPVSDPELNSASTAPAFALNQVDVAYKFVPLIPGRIFNLGLVGFPACGGAGNVSCCNSDGTCVLHRSSIMRVMN